MSYSSALATYLPGMTASPSADPITPAVGDLHITADSLPQYDHGGTASDEKADFPNVLYAILHALYTAWTGIATADRPANMTVYKTVSNTAVDGENEVTFTVRFTTQVTSENVKAEA